jgi:hypothetical protein
MNPIPPQASAWLELAKIIKDPFLVFLTNDNSYTRLDYFCVDEKQSEPCWF